MTLPGSHERALVDLARDAARSELAAEAARSEARRLRAQVRRLEVERETALAQRDDARAALARLRQELLLFQADAQRELEVELESVGRLRDLIDDDGVGL